MNCAKRSWFLIGLLLLVLVIPEARCAAQPAPVFQYAVKFLCGRSPGAEVGVAPGEYFTAINIHNPTGDGIEFRKKFALAMPGQRAGQVSRFFDAKLGPDEAMEIECREVRDRTGASDDFITGFVVIESKVELDVVAVYTAVGRTELVETLHVDRVPPRRLTVPLPDLVAVPDPRPGFGFCRLTGDGKLRVVVMNQGNAPAPRSTTTVEFPPGRSFDLATRRLQPGESESLELAIPAAAWDPDADFKITVDSKKAVTESDEGNNEGEGTCIG